MTQPISRSIINDRDHTLGAAYPVTLPAFEGPLDLLLHLIEREELDISEISLLAVTDQYLQTLEHLEEIEPGALTDFLVIASRLLLIKSKRLLPQVKDEEGEEEDAGDSLIRRLIEYRQFKRAAASLKQREDLRVRAYVRLTPPAELETQRPRKADLSNVDLPGLQAALRKALLRIPVEPPPPKLQPYKITLAEQIGAVRHYFEKRLAGQIGERKPTLVAFSELLDNASSRVEVIVTFLAVLELIKREELRAVQKDTFGEIMLQSEPVEESAGATDLGHGQPGEGMQADSVGPAAGLAD